MKLSVPAKAPVKPKTVKAPERPAVKPPAVITPPQTRNPIQPAAVAPGQPHAHPEAPRLPTREEVEAMRPHVTVMPETPPEPQEAAPVYGGRRPEDEGEPHWMDPVTGFPDTSRRRDGSSFSTPKS